MATQLREWAKWLFVFAGGIFLLTCFWVLYRPRTEGFEDAAPSGPEQELQTLYGDVANILCPALQQIEEDLMRDPANAKKNAATVVRKAMGGRPIFCPVPTQLIDLPADIGDRFTRTVAYLDKKTDDLRKKLENQQGDPATCNQPTPSATEAFVSKETFVSKEDEDAEPPASKEDESLQDEQKKQILQARLDALKPLVPPALDALKRIKTNTDYLLKQKELAESGQLRPGCPMK